MDKRQSLGKLGEEFATSYLISKGYRIIKRNYSSRYGEIDVIALRDHELFFIEVKARSSLKMGYPSESVNKRKLQHLEMTARDFLRRTNWDDYNYNFKIIEILVNEIDEM